MAALTAQEVLMLELINRARLNPLGEAARYGIDLNEGLAPGTLSAASKQPLALSDSLFNAADAHSQSMINFDYFDHVDPNTGSTPQSRANAAGYVGGVGENIAFRGSTGPIDATSMILAEHQDLFVDTGTSGRGHRVNILDPNYQELGVGQVLGLFTSQGTTFNASMVTEDFGVPSASGIFITGVAFNDADHDDFYSVGEGLGGLTVSVGSTSTSSAAVGEYTLHTTVTGAQTITLSGGGLAGAVTFATVLAGENIKLDVASGNILHTSASGTVSGPIAVVEGLGVDGLSLTTGSGVQTILGTPGSDTLNSGDGADVLNGGAGNDTMTGGTGDDLYYVQDTGDVIVENPGEGSDSVIAYVTYTLPANVEAIYTLAGSGATGNSSDNLLDGAYAASSGQTLDGQGGNDVIYGTFFNDTLIGGAGSDALYDIGGNDTMQGGSGDDAYFVNSAADVVRENAGEGSDTIYASVNFTLPANVEVLEPYGAATRGDGNGDANVLLGVASDHGLTLDAHGGNDVIYGSNFDDTLVGGAGEDLLWGFGGNDTMQGGTGNDVYIVEQAGDVVQENAGEGNDTIYASVNITLPTNVENLFVYGGATTGTGNSGDNYIVNEFITTGVTLTGGGGNDIFVFIPHTANGTTITDFAGNGAGVGDVLEFAAYGPGATFTNVDATHWQVNYNGGASHDIITFSNAAAINPADVLFA